MRIVLVHNESAGNGMAREAVRRLIEAAGHRVIAQVTAAEHLREALTPDTDLVVVAGGDGTVQSVVLHASGCGVPLAVIPLGTANNIAASLGVDGAVSHIPHAWAQAGRVPFPVGVARGPWGERRFVESAGAGLVARGIAAMDSEAPHAEEGHRLEMLRKAARRFGDVLAELRPRLCRLSLDGEELEQELLLVEVLNIPSVGPRLRLASRTRPADGFFEVVVAAEEQRADLLRYLRDRKQDAESEIRLPTRRAARVALSGWDSVHVDDHVVSNLAGACITMATEPAAIEMLTFNQW